MAQKLIISKPGYNALTETDVNNQVFNASYDTLKYYTSGYVDLSLNANANPETYVTHDLGYTPFFIAYLNGFPTDSDYTAVPLVSYGFGSYSTVDAYATTSRIYFTIKSDATQDYTRRIVYKIFRNSLGL